MKYCSECASRLVRHWIVEEGRDRLFCETCAAVQYQNPKVVVIAVVTCGESLLVCQRAIDPGKGLWALPTGYVESGETLEGAAMRETFEETGVTLDAARLELYTVTDMPGIEQVAIAFRADLGEMPPLRPNAECLSVCFMPIVEIRLEQFAWIETMGDGPDCILKELLGRRFGIHWHSIGVDGQFRSRSYPILHSR